MRELVSIAPDGAELFVENRVVRVEGLEPSTTYEIEGVPFTTMEDLGALVEVVATANDVHFGETVCGLTVEGEKSSETFRSADGEPPYPEVMNASVVADIAACTPSVVVVKGDLTDDGVATDYERFLEVWGGAFGSRLVHVRGNHDAYRGQSFAAWPCQARALDGVTIALLDTSREGHASGFLGDDQIEWLDELGATADRPVLVMGHHPAWNLRRDQGTEARSGTSPEDTIEDPTGLVGVIARRPALSSYLAGHSHRNRCKRIDGIPFVEVACVKDFPGGWAEYRIYERGIAQIFHRASAPDAIAWAERTRGMFAGLYGAYAMGNLDDRSFVIETRLSG